VYIEPAVDIVDIQLETVEMQLVEFVAVAVEMQQQQDKLNNN